MLWQLARLEGRGGGNGWLLAVTGWAEAGSQRYFWHSATYSVRFSHVRSG